MIDQMLFVQKRRECPIPVCLPCVLYIHLHHILHQPPSPFIGFNRTPLYRRARMDCSFPYYRDQNIQGLAGQLLDSNRSVVDPHSDAFYLHDWTQVSIDKHIPELQRYAAEPLIYLVTYTFLPEPVKSHVASWVNGPAAQYFHCWWPTRLQSSNAFEAASVMIALHVFDTLVSPAVGRSDVRLVDDLDSLVTGEWVWSRTELVRRMTQSLANVVCTESRKPNASQELRSLSAILASLFDWTQDDTSFFGRFWTSRFQGDSCQEALRQVKEWVALPYQGDPPTFPLVTDDGPILSDSFQPRVPRRSAVKPVCGALSSL